MSLPVVLRRAAERELYEAANWYEDRCQKLGEALISETQTVFDRLSEQPDRYPVVHKDIREAPLSRFPYCVYYRVKSERIVVLSVFHTSRDPSTWQNRS